MDPACSCAVAIVANSIRKASMAHRLALRFIVPPQINQGRAKPQTGLGCRLWRIVVHLRGVSTQKFRSSSHLIFWRFTQDKLQNLGFRQELAQTQKGREFLTLA